MAGERFRPGLLDFGLNAGKVAGHYQLDSSLVTTRILLKEYDRDNYPTTAAAILNLQGAFLYFNNKYEDAIGVFNEVQRIDVHNLNARANLHHIYKELGFWSEKHEVSSEQSATDKRVKGEEQLRAICQAEQAFAIMFDCHVSTDELEKYNRAKRLFEQSEKQWKSLLETEAMQFKFWYAELLQRLLLRIKSDGDRIVNWKKGVRLITDITNAEVATDKPCLLAKTYTCLGQFVYKAKKFENFKTEEQEIKMKAYEKIWLDDPGLIFKKALEIQESHSMEILTRYLLYLKGIKEPTEDQIKDMIRVVEQIDNARQQEQRNEQVINQPKPLHFPHDKNTTGWFSMSVASSGCLTLYKTLTNKRKPGTPRSICSTPIAMPTIKTSKFEDIDPSVQPNETLDDRPQTTPYKSALETDGVLNSGCTTPKQPLDSQQKTLKNKVSLSPIITDSVPNSRCTTPVLPEQSDLRNTDSPEKYLDNAIKYGEVAASLNQTNDIYINLGVAYHKNAMIKKEKGKVQSSKKLFLKALCNFLHALRHLDGRKRSYIHRCHADCLWDMKEYRPAIESYKRAIECGTKYVDKVYHRMFACYGKLLIKGPLVDDVTDRNNLIHETCYWLKERIGKGVKKDITDLEHLIDECKGLVRDEDANYKYDVYSVVADIVCSMVEHEISKDEELESHKEEHPTIKYLLPNLQKNADQSVAILCKLIQSHTTQLAKPLQKCMQYVIDTLHDDNIKNETVSNLSKSFIEARSLSHNKRDYKIVWIFEKMGMKCPNLSRDVALKIKKEDHNLGAVLLHLVGHGEKHELKPSVVEQDGHYDSEVLFLLKKEDKQHLQKCAKRYEDNLLQLNLQPERRFHRKDIEPKVRNTMYDYDFYVIYNANDTEWVLCQLLQTLEQKHGFKGCIDMRDSTPGRQKIDEMNSNIAKSYRTLAIVTEHFVNDALCKYQLHQMLLNQMENTSQALIPVQKQKGIMDRTDLPRELHSIVSVTTVDHSDWERLVKALE